MKEKTLPLVNSTQPEWFGRSMALAQHQDMLNSWPVWKRWLHQKFIGKRCPCCTNGEKTDGNVMILPLWLFAAVCAAILAGVGLDHWIQRQQDCAHAKHALAAMHRLVETTPLTPEHLRDLQLWREQLLKERVENCGDLDQ